MALVATVGGSTSNSFITRADAQTYFDDRLNITNWTSATDATKDDALVTATLRIDQERFIGYPVTETQALQWPRSYVPKPSGLSYYATDAIPKPIKDAVCEYALELLTSDTLPETGLSNFKSITVDVISIVMNHPVSAGSLPDQVVRLLRGLRVGGSGAVMVRS